MPDIEHSAIVLSHSPGGLGAVRSLARRGVRVIAFAYEPEDLVLHSRFPAVAEVIPGASDEEKEAALLERLLALDEEQPVLLTSSDQLVEFLGRHENLLADRFLSCLPDQDMLSALNDKRRETQLIASLGIPIPKTLEYLPDDALDLERQLRLPIIFKPYSYAVQAALGRKNAVVRTRSELLEFYETHKKILSTLLAQEVIPGPDTASWVCSCTFDRSHRLLDCSIKQKLRMAPPHFGISTLAVSRSNVAVVALVRKLGAGLAYSGHAGIEFRWDERDKTYKYIELNPRIPANVEFDEATQLPTVWNSYRAAIGPVQAAGTAQRDGVIFLDLGDDLIHRMDDGESLWAILRSYAGLLFKRRKGQFFAYDDPLPGIVAAGRFSKRMGHALWRRLQGTAVV